MVKKIIYDDIVHEDSEAITNLLLLLLLLLVLLILILLVLLLKSLALAKVGKAKLFINCHRNPTSICTTKT